MEGNAIFPTFVTKGDLQRNLRGATYNESVSHSFPSIEALFRISFVNKGPTFFLGLCEAGESSVQFTFSTFSLYSLNIIY